MKQFTMKIEGYTFEELPSKVQDQLIESYEVYDGWHDYILEDSKQHLEEIGVGDPDIKYTGFYSQGDGLSFTSQHVDLTKLFKHMKETNYFDVPDAWIDAAENGDIDSQIGRITYHYCHENTVRFYITVARPLTEKDQSQMEFLLNGWLKDTCVEIYKRLREEYEEYTSHDSIKNEFIERGHYYTIKGEYINTYACQES